VHLMLLAGHCTVGLIMPLSSLCIIRSNLVPASNGLDMSQPHYPFYRRIGRRCLRLIRPLALPFLARLQARVSSGVDASCSAQVLGQVLSAQHAINARLGTLADTVHMLDRKVDGLALNVNKSQELSALAVERSIKLLQVRGVPLGDEALARSALLTTPVHVGARSDMIIQNAGYCAICMEEATFSSQEEWLRDNYFCEKCKSIPRQRAIVHVLSYFRPDWRLMQMHESSPTVPFFAQQCTAYSNSFFYEDAPVGTYKDGNRCENLEALTFPDESFDLFITQDVLEHVFHPDRALAEIMRVLRPGGAHVFTAPKNKHLLKSYRRAAFVNGRVEHIHEPNYHGNPIGDGRSLVTWDYGADFDDLIQEWSGYCTSNFIIRDRSLGIDAECLDVFVTQKSDANRRVQPGLAAAEESRRTS
jgi:hypothetical protein